MILELENIKQDGVKTEPKLPCPGGYMSCDGRIACVCDWKCDCPTCFDEPINCM